MKLLLIASLFLPATAFAQDTAPVDAAAHAKINTAVRADVAARVAPADDSPATVGNVRVRTARVGQKTVTLQDGSLPEGQGDAGAPINRPGG